MIDEEQQQEMREQAHKYLKELKSDLKQEINAEIKKLKEALNPTGQKEEVLCPKPWRMDVNDRYQQGVSVVTGLSTAGLFLPIVFLKDISSVREGATIISEIDWSVWTGWVLLSVSIICAFIYHFFSAKYIKLSWGRDADLLGGLVYKANPKTGECSETTLEWILDWSHGAMEP